MTIVLDTNVFISGLNHNNNAPSQIIDAWRFGNVQLAYSPQMLSELSRVLHYPKVAALLEDEADYVHETLLHLETSGILTEGREQIDLITNDPSDNIILGAAKESQADMSQKGNKNR